MTRTEKRPFFCLLLITGLFLFLPACNPTEVPPPSAPIVAMVDDAEVTRDEFLAAFRNLHFGNELDEESEEGLKIKRRILEGLIEEKLILAEAGRRNLSISDDELEDEIKRIRLGHSDENFKRLLENQNIAYADWKEKLRGDMQRWKLIETTLPRKFEFSEEEIKTFYRENRDQFREPETIRARQIVVQGEQIALDIQRELVQGASFEELARKHSFSPDKDRGGDLGYFSRGEMPEEFNVVFTLDVGEVSPVVLTPYGHHIFKLEDRKRSRLVPLEEAREKIIGQLSDLRHEKLFTLWVEGLKERARITINEAILNQPTGQNPQDNDE